jgi:hypothetical protein
MVDLLPLTRTTSPLSPLRLTYDNEITSASIPRRVPSTEEESLVNKKHINLDSFLNPERNNDDFSYNLDFNHIVSSSTEDLNDMEQKSTKTQFTDEQIKKVMEVAKVFQDTRKVLKADSNIVDPLQADGTHDTNHKKIHVSRAGHLRAEKVKAMFAVKYIYIQRQYDVKEANKGKPELDNGVDGVYNPLQVIRNRKIRAKYHEYPKPLSIKTLPPACNVFSKHSRNKKMWKMVWSVELNELLCDFSWRVSHWNELVNAKKELWFPEASPHKHKHNHRHHNHHHKGHIRKRLHDKLFEERSDEDGKSSKLLSTSSQSDSNGSSTKSSSKLQLNLKLKSKPKKKLYNGSSSSSNVDDFSLLNDTKSDSNGSQGNLLKHTIVHQPLVAEEDSDGKDDEPLTFASPARSPVPVIKIDSVEALSDVSIKSVTNLRPDIDQVIEDDETTETKCKIVLDAREVELSEIFTHFKYMNQFLKLKSNYLLEVYPRYTEMVNEQLDEIMSHQVYNILHSIVRINDQYLLSFETLYVSFSNEIEAIIRLVNDDHSIRVDNLLSSSDRSIGEINTSLASEVRKISERIDKLSGSLCDYDILTRSEHKSNFKMSLRESNYKPLYLILENFIVITLRLIWAIVNIYKGLAAVVMVIWKILKYFIH